MSSSDELYYFVNDVVKETIDMMQKLAAMGEHRLQLIKISNQETWRELHENKKLWLWDLSRDTVSWREAKLEAIRTATIYLDSYGGSAKRKKQGLAVLSEMAENIKAEMK